MKVSFNVKQYKKFKRITNTIIRLFTSKGLKPVYTFKNTTGKPISHREKDVIALKEQNPDFCPELGYLEFVYGNYSFFLVGHILEWYGRKYHSALPAIVGDSLIKKVTGFKFEWSKCKSFNYCIISFSFDVRLEGFQKIYKKYYKGGCPQNVVTKKLYEFFQNFS